jgi:lipid II:glycine glycyltransferase (peptidoglycan interpeptide bridge formation enzyme)
MSKYGLKVAHKENMPSSTYVIDLQKLPSDLLKDLSSSHRSKIKKAEKAGVTISQVQTSAELAAVYEMLCNT